MSAPAFLRRRWRPPGPYDLRRSLRVLQCGPKDPAYRVVGGALWRASRTPLGPGAVRLATDGDEVAAEAWGPGADWLLDTLPALLGAEDEASATAFAPHHRVVARGWKRHPGIRLVRTGRMLESLIPAILGQKVTTDEAFRAWQLLLRWHGEPAPGPAAALHMYVMPDARGWATIPSWDWHRAGVDHKRSGTVVRAAQVAHRLEEAAALAPEAAAARLQTVSGIGQWTAAEAIQRALGAPDAVTIGDLHLPRIVGYSLTGERDADDARMLELLEPYAAQGQRHRATRYITLAGAMPPRRQPKRQIWDIAQL
ncbi:DNA-3-methyladenine glycosylase [Streptomyces sp. TRM68367]|uniref:DNA-3-methyladenine glycosylase family protein n=1 Tax=Streptomyces sp. TRM68367 TaxID=2758415 RepID=UPI00165C2B91|nr:DNA-3-methyladenine glycosylase 2 family protein [Streptomyces sp. TRM68367]MBC9731280.1 DNA-3-methyladenine glycosylase 2 family protein [Streptomyces sp. TRM68367]